MARDNATYTFFVLTNIINSPQAGQQKSLNETHQTLSLLSL